MGEIGRGRERERVVLSVPGRPYLLVANLASARNGTH